MLQQLAGREHTGEREEIVSSPSRLRVSITQCCLAAKGSAIDLKDASLAAVFVLSLLFLFHV